MSVGTVRFYRMRGSLSSGEYPLFSQGQDLSAFLVGSATVKYANGLQTKVSVPMFNGYDTVNIAELNGQYYWVTGFTESTTVNGSVEYVLDFCAPSSFFRRSDSVKGNWHKLPYRSGYLRQQIMNDVIKIKDTELFDELDCPDTLGRDYWVQVSGYNADNEIIIYGFFISYLYDNQALGFSNYGEYCDPTDQNKRYPAMLDVFKSVSDTLPGLDAKKIIDMSISRRCPYYAMETVISATISSLNIKTGQYGNILIPDIQNNNGTYVYRVNKTDFITPLFNPQFQSQTITLSLDDHEMDCGNISVLDWNRNSIMNIVPTDSEALTITARMYADMSGIYTIIESGDQQITLTEGKIPYFENSWDTYRAYQLDTDRMSMRNAIEYARYSAETDAITGAMNTTINAVSTGVMAGAVTGSGMAGAAVGIASQVAGLGVSMYASDRARELSERQAKDNFELSKKRAIQQPQTAYNTAYGQIYCKLNLMNPLCVTVSLPNHLNADYYAEWCSDMGFPAEGVSSESIRTGFYQGKILSNSVTRTGMHWDRCNEVFMNGFKFVNP